MLNNKLLVKVKTSKVIYKIYSFCMRTFLGFLRLFIRVDSKIILFNSLGGRKYDDSPKAIYLKMLEDKRFKGFKFFWAFNEPNKFDIPKGTKIRNDSLKYFITALKAGCWITNSSIERGIKFKNKKTLYLNTWHGTPIKKMGSDICKNKQVHIVESKCDYFNVQSDFEADVVGKSYDIFSQKKSKILKIGLPRNDVLAVADSIDIVSLKKEMGLPLNKKIILYAPTFRDYEIQKNDFSFKSPFNWDKWKKVFDAGYIILFRAHYAITKKYNALFDNKNIFDYSFYPNLNDLMLVSDFLISDYSSIIFDYSIMDKPILLYTYDYDVYSKERGMYFDIRDYFYSSEKENCLIEKIISYDTEEEKKKTKNFRKKYLQYYGNASKKTVDVIYKELNKK